MSQIVIPDETLIREPNLLVPGRKPAGPVKIDWAHPLARGLDCFSAPVNYGALELVTNTINSNSDPANVVPYSFSKIRGIRIPGIYTYTYAVSSAAAGDVTGNQITVAISGVAFDTVPGIILDKSPSNTEAYRLFARRISSGPRFRLFTSGGATNVDAGGLESPASGEAFTTVGTYDGAAQKIYINGVEKASAAKSGNVTSSASAISFNNTDPDSDSDFLLSWFAVWRRALSSTEVREMYHDPYQFLIPA